MKGLILILFFAIMSLQASGQWELYDCPNNYDAECIPQSGRSYSVYVGCSCNGRRICLGGSNFDNCEGITNRTISMIKFEATGTTVNISTIMTKVICPGFVGSGYYVGLMENCLTNCLVSDGDCNSPSSPISISYSGLVIGRIYYIYFAPCTTTECEVDVDISFSGIGQSIEGLIDLTVLSNNCEAPLCQENDLNFSYEINDMDTGLEYLFDENYLMTLEITGPENILLEVPSDQGGFDLRADDYDLAPGNYTICLTKVETGCNEIPFDDCTSFEILPVDHSIGTYSVCEHDLREGFGEDILGYSVDAPGEYLRETDLCECFPKVITIKELEEVEEEVVIELCPEDYPFEYFHEVEYDYTGSTIKEYLSIIEGSVQNDYTGTECDTFIRLILENSLCDICQLPLSLKDSEIVLCIPFNSISLDFSGYDNRVIEHDIGYEDFIVDGKKVWSADFDGRNDYVEIPFATLLDQPVFSFAFEFDKYNQFRHGPVETLINMGTDNQNRFSIDLLETSESGFDMIGKFYSGAQEYILSAQGLFIDIEYDVAFVVEGNLIKMYLDGDIVDEILLPSALNVGRDEILLGVNNSGNTLSQYYQGYFNDFKYWAESLSGRDILFLHDPEAEFVESIDVPLTCCEQAMINDSLLISFDSPVQTIIVPEASETGYDSTYVYNFVADDPVPVINQALLPQDIVIDYQKQCDEFCTQTASWDVNPQSIFSDNCQGLTFEQSHYSPIQIDQNNPEIEVTYAAIDACGSRSEFSFLVVLNCMESNQTVIADDNLMSVNTNGACFDTDGAICVNADIDISPSFIDMNSDISTYNVADHQDLAFEFSINGQSQSYSLTSQTAFKPNFTTAGIYEVCLETISNDCVTRFVGSCETFNLYESQLKYYGSYLACADDHHSVVPSEASAGIRGIVNNQHNIYTYNGTDACGCVYSESIEIINVSTGLARPYTVELCEGESVSILGQTFDGTVEYNSELITFENATVQINSNGQRCDSLIELTLIKLEESYVEQSVSICEGGEYEGYTEAGSYDFVYPSGAVNGCDSTFVMNLSVDPISMIEIAESICEGDTYMGYGEEGDYVETYSDIAGCDSIVSLNLTVRPISSIELSEVICEGDIFMGYSVTGNYQDVYTNAVGCDSIVSLELTVLDELHPDCIGTSSDDIQKSSYLIYPNPTSDYLYVKNINDDLLSVTNLVIYSKDGKQVMAIRDFNEKRIDVSVLYSGVYFLNVKSGDQEYWHKFLKF